MYNPRTPEKTWDTASALLDTSISRVKATDCSYDLDNSIT